LRVAKCHCVSHHGLELEELELFTLLVELLDIVLSELELAEDLELSELVLISSVLELLSELELSELELSEELELFELELFELEELELSDELDELEASPAPFRQSQTAAPGAALVQTNICFSLFVQIAPTANGRPSPAVSTLSFFAFGTPPTE
jgi:hypothetical protein